MKRLQIMIEEDVDAALDRIAEAEGTSKAALIRHYVAQHVKPAPPLESDPLWSLVGTYSGDEDESESFDEIVYGTG